MQLFFLSHNTLARKSSKRVENIGPIMSTTSMNTGNHQRREWRQRQCIPLMTQLFLTSAFCLVVAVVPMWTSTGTTGGGITDAFSIVPGQYHSNNNNNIHNNNAYDARESTLQQRQQHPPLPVLVRLSTNTKASTGSTRIYSLQQHQQRTAWEGSTTLDTGNDMKMTQQEATIRRSGRYESIVRNYNTTDPFRPVSWLQNNHVQTIGGYILRKYNTKVRSQQQSSSRMSSKQQPFSLAYIPHNEPWYQTLQRIIKAVTMEVSDRDSTATTTATTTTHPPFWDRRERIDTPDGDFFHVDIKRQPAVSDDAPPLATPPKSIVILLHGLQSNSHSPVCMEMASAILLHNNNNKKDSSRNNNDCEVHCINFRGCSGIPNDTVGGYHLGYTNDVKYYLQQLHQQYRMRYTGDDDNDGSTNKQLYPPIYLTGFSLGANVALKCIGELGSAAEHAPYNIHGASVLCLPLDQVANAPVLAQPGINRLVYTQNLLQSLRKKCTEQHEQFYGRSDSDDDDYGVYSDSTPKYNYTKVMLAETITEFDNSFIAPVYNFTDCWDYYTQTSSIHYLYNITVPTLVINAQDDPFFDNTIWPTDHSVEHGGTVPIKMIQTKHGGHLGYYFHQIDNASDERLSTTAFGKHNVVVPSWSAWETGKFISHVHDSLYSFPK